MGSNPMIHCSDMYSEAFTDCANIDRETILYTGRVDHSLGMHLKKTWQLERLTYSDLVVVKLSGVSYC